MYVHTIELIRDVDTDQPECELIRTLTSFGFRENQVYLFLHSADFKKNRISHSLFYDYRHLGLKTITLQRRILSSYSIPSYFIKLSLNPLLSHNGPQFLYTPSAENNERFYNEFREIINDNFNCDEEFADLNTWRTNRVDYTHDFIFDTREQAELFKQLPYKTTKLTRRKRLKNRKLKKYKQSTAEGNRSTKVMFYDKSEQIKDVLENCEGYSEGTLAFISRLLGNRIRFEVQCENRKIINISRTKHFDRNIMNFLDQDLSRQILKENYEQTIGTGDFYTSYHAGKRLEDELGASKKKKAAKKVKQPNANDKESVPLWKRIHRLMRLIAQARSLAVGRQQFQQGRYIKNTDIKVKGCAKTFRKYLNDLKKININPVVIPKEWSCSPESETHGYGITFLHNPYDEL